MGTRSVGVRELKEHAPKLVERASGGERIVITRYGKAVAVLGPATQDSSTAGRGRFTAWQRERECFERLLPSLMPKLRGRYVAVAGGKVVGEHADPEALYRLARRLVGASALYIGRVGEPEPIVDMPGFTVA